MKKYIAPNMNIVALLTEDIITTSGQGLSLGSGDADLDANTHTISSGFWG